MQPGSSDLGGVTRGSLGCGGVEKDAGTFEWARSIVNPLAFGVVVVAIAVGAEHAPIADLYGVSLDALP